jgi:chorismate mutase
VNDIIWGIYFNELLPLLAKNGDDGNYAVTAASDLACLQVKRNATLYHAL